MSLPGAIGDSSLGSEQALQSQRLGLLQDFIPRNDTGFTEHLLVFNASFSGSRSYGVIWTFMGLSVLLRKFIIAFSASSKG